MDRSVGKRAVVKGSSAGPDLRRCAGIRAENLLEDSMAESKNALEIRRDEKFLHKRAAGHGVFDAVAYNGAAAVLGEGMFMHPERIGSFRLPVDETERRFPDGNLTLPAQREAAQPQAVI